MVARVLIADSHAPVRSAVAAALLSAGLAVCAEAADADAAVEAALREQPDACVLDVHLAGGGVRAVARIAAALRETPIVMLSSTTDRDALLASLRAGATGYILKNGPPERIPAAVRGVLAGEAVVETPFLRMIIDEVRSANGQQAKIPGRNVELTPRESEILGFLLQGKSTGEIAYALSITDVTARRHISELVRKAGVEGRKALVALFAERSET